MFAIVVITATLNFNVVVSVLPGMYPTMALCNDAIVAIAQRTIPADNVRIGWKCYGSV